MEYPYVCEARVLNGVSLCGWSENPWWSISIWVKWESLMEYLYVGEVRVLNGVSLCGWSESPWRSISICVPTRINRGQSTRASNLIYDAGTQLSSVKIALVSRSHFAKNLGVSKKGAPSALVSPLHHTLVLWSHQVSSSFTEGRFVQFRMETAVILWCLLW